MPTNRTKKTRFRPTMIRMEDRCMADAKMVGALDRPPQAAVAGRPVPVEVAPLSMAGQVSLAVARPAATAVRISTPPSTIINRSTAKITYNFEWGNGAWTSYTSHRFGQERVHYINCP